MRSMLDFEGTTLGDFTFSTGGLGEDILAVVTGDDGLGVAENNVGFVASSAFDIHEVGVGGGNESF